MRGLVQERSRKRYKVLNDRQHCFQLTILTSGVNPGSRTRKKLTWLVGWDSVITRGVIATWGGRKLGWCTNYGFRWDFKSKVHKEIHTESARFGCLNQMNVSECMRGGRWSKCSLLPSFAETMHFFMYVNFKSCVLFCPRVECKILHVGESQ